MFSLKLNSVPSSNERVPRRDERRLTHPYGPSPATDTFQGLTECTL